MRRFILFVTAVSLYLAGYFPAHALDFRPAAPQTPESLCQCAGDESASKGGIRTFDEFNAKFGATFPTRTELELAWNVYKAVNRCDSVVVLGRLTDTGSFENKPGYCVLRTLPGWTMRVNQAFVRGGTDRGARIQLVSDMPPETMGRDVDINKIGSEDRETNWIVIYNNEIQWVLATGRYRLDYDKSKKITPSDPAYLHASSNGNTPPSVGTPGSLQLVEITPDPKCETWDFYSSCDPKAGQIVARATWGTATYQWTPPPQRIDGNGFTINLSVSEQTPKPEGRVATGINLTGGGLELDPPNPTVPIGAPNQGFSGNLSVKIKPPKNASGDYYLKIGVYWGPGFTYHYRAVK